MGTSSTDPTLDTVGIPKWITKTRRGGKNDTRDIDGRVYADNEHPDICSVRTLLKFQRRKTPKQIEPDQPFLWSVKPSAEKDPNKERFWYSDNRMGVNTIGGLFKKS